MNWKWYLALTIDLQVLCVTAAYRPVRELIQQEREKDLVISQIRATKLSFLIKKYLTIIFSSSLIIIRHFPKLVFSGKEAENCRRKGCRWCFRKEGRNWEGNYFEASKHGRLEAGKESGIISKVQFSTPNTRKGYVIYFTCLMSKD